MERPDFPFFAELSELAPYDKSPALYVHIPFCAAKCGYCDFFSVPFRRDMSMELIAAVHRQLAAFDAALQPAEYATVFIGGGTPNVLPITQFEKLLNGILPYAQKSAAAASAGLKKEWTVEMNPEYVSEEYIRMLKNYPVNRISLGVQSFSGSFLAALGRRCSEKQVRIALDRILKLWGRDLSIDLLCAVPGQAADDAAADIEAALEYRPAHISYYTLTFEEGTPLAAAAESGATAVPGEEEQLLLWRTGMELLRRAGYKRYEVSNFALEGKECLHNIHYWEMDPYIGCGPGAVSTIPAGAIAYRYAVKKRIGKELKIEREEVGEDSFLLEYIMMGLRKTGGIDKDKFFSVFHRDFMHFFDRELHKWKKAGLAAENETSVYLTGPGLSVMNALVTEAALAIEKKLTT